MRIINKIFATNEVGSVEGSDKLIEKYEKLSKTGKSSKFWKSAKSEKKLSKSRNSPNFNSKENKPSFLTLNARTIFNSLWLAFTKAI